MDIAVGEPPETLVLSRFFPIALNGLFMTIPVHLLSKWDSTTTGKDPRYCSDKTALGIPDRNQENAMRRFVDESEISLVRTKPS